MTFEELLIACSAGEMPRVSTCLIINYATSKFGVVTNIKHEGLYKGCAVLFDGMKWSTWFHASDDTDKRSRYMRDLTLIK